MPLVRSRTIERSTFAGGQGGGALARQSAASFISLPPLPTPRRSSDGDLAGPAAAGGGGGIGGGGGGGGGASARADGGGASSCAGESTAVVILISAEKESFELPARVAQTLGLVRAQVGDDALAASIAVGGAGTFALEVPMVKSAMLAKIVEFLQHHAVRRVQFVRTRFPRLPPRCLNAPPRAPTSPQDHKLPTIEKPIKSCDVRRGGAPRANPAPAIAHALTRPFPLSSFFPRAAQGRGARVGRGLCGRDGPPHAVRAD